MFEKTEIRFNNVSVVPVPVTLPLATIGTEKRLEAPDSVSLSLYYSVEEEFTKSKSISVVIHKKKKYYPLSLVTLVKFSFFLVTGVHYM